MLSLGPDCRAVLISEELGSPLAWLKDRRKEEEKERGKNMLIFKVRLAMGGGKKKGGVFSSGGL